MTDRFAHGGGCCGMTHIRGMNGDSRDVLRAVDRHIATRPQNHLVEVVLTDMQVKRNPAVAKGLKERGFKLVSRFYNDNSRNYCNVLHRYPLTGRGSGKKNSPFNKI